MAPNTDSNRVDADLSPSSALELNDLQTAWNEDGRHYEDKSGQVEMNGETYEFRVSFVDLDNVDLNTFPTNRRAVTEVGPDLRSRPDIAVCVMPGWGETSAQFEGDFLECLLEELKVCGYKNPKVVGVNVSGRGTSEYLKDGNKERISRIGMMDEVDDAGNLVYLLDRRGYFGQGSVETPVTVIGHSMGHLNAMRSLSVFNNGRFNHLRADRLLSMMPAVDGPLKMLRGKFLAAVRKQVPSAVWQAWMRREGSLELNEADHNRIMFGDENSRDPEQFKRGVPDSARRFLDVTLNLKERFDDVLRIGGVGDGVNFTVVKGGKDNLVPDSAIDYLPKIVGERELKDRGRMKGLVEVAELPDISHSLPFWMSNEQRAQVKKMLKEFFLTH